MMTEYCSTYCEHNAYGECQCQPCIFIRTETGFRHANGCRFALPETMGQSPPPGEGGTP